MLWLWWRLRVSCDRCPNNNTPLCDTLYFYGLSCSNAKEMGGQSTEESRHGQSSSVNENERRLNKKQQWRKAKKS